MSKYLDEIASERIFRQGEIIDLEAEPFKSADLVIVRTGRIEIFERSDCLGFFAHRPVSIYGPGDMFGIFELMDRICASLRLEQPKESWEVAAGSGSVLLLDYASEDTIEQMIFDRLPDEEYARIGRTGFQPRDLFKVLLKDEHTQLDFYRFGDLDQALREMPIIFDLLMRACWISTQEYRLSRNIYNQQFYDNIFGSVWRTLKRRHNWSKLNWITGREALLPELIYSTIEALERPPLNNPMFFRRASDPDNMPSEGGAEPYANLSLCTVLRAHRPREGLMNPELEPIMYYPLGFQNLSVSRFLENRFDLYGKNNAAAIRLKTFFNPTNRLDFREQRKTADNKTKRVNGRDDRTSFGLKSVVDLVIKAFLEEYRSRQIEYPFEVEARLQRVGNSQNHVPLLLVWPKETRG